MQELIYISMYLGVHKEAGGSGCEDRQAVYLNEAVLLCGWSSGQLETHTMHKDLLCLPSVYACAFLCVSLLCVLSISSTSHSAPDLPCSVKLNVEMWHIWVMQPISYINLHLQANGSPDLAHVIFRKVR